MNSINVNAKFDGFVKYIILKSTIRNEDIFYLGKYTSTVATGLVDLNHFTGTLLLRNLSNDEISFYKFDNGEKKLTQTTRESGANLRTEACVTIVTCSWGNWNCGAVNIASTTNEISCDPPSWSPCYGAVWEINNSETVLSCDTDPNDPNSPGVPVILNPEFASGVVYTPPAIPVTNVREYLKCFNTIRSGAAYKVSLYADQPVPGARTPFNPAAQGKHTVGHAFLEFEMTMPRSNLYPSGDVVRRSIGFYPKGTSNPVHPKSEGIMGNDAGYNGSLDVIATFKGDEKSFNAMLALAETYANGGYDIYTRNCSNFTSDALALMGVNIPNSWQQSYWYTAGGVNVTGPSLGFYVDLIKDLQNPKLLSRFDSGVSPKSNAKVCD